ncbi:globin [Haloferula sp.]|uniref:globin domain-containing protein n=1 Tax=Haloferula sp. TaxID=2497595 RepID=UPI00329AF243
MPRLVETLEQMVAREVGPEGIAKMVGAFYQKVRTDDLIGPMYPDGDWEGSEERLRDFLKFRLLGDPTYTFKRGHPRLRMRHMGFSIGEAERDRWVELMSESMVETGVPDGPREKLVEFFAQVADFMRNQ